MATKNLARTIIEGGRARSNQWDRNHSHRQERAATREFLAKVRTKHDGFDDLATPRRSSVYKRFADKLGAPRRWLESQAGRPWDKVHGEIFARFDPRTLAGRHIIFDHLLQEVRVHPEQRRWFSSRVGLYVDRHGILRNPKPRRERHRFDRRPTQLPAQARLWANGRRVATAGQVLFWLEEASACDSCHGSRRAPCCCPVIDGTPAHGAHVHFRQGERLSEEDLERWYSLDLAVQQLLSGPRRSGAR